MGLSTVGSSCDRGYNGMTFHSQLWGSRFSISPCELPLSSVDFASGEVQAGVVGHISFDCGSCVRSNTFPRKKRAFFLQNMVNTPVKRRRNTKAKSDSADDGKKKKGGKGVPAANKRGEKAKHKKPVAAVKKQSVGKGKKTPTKKAPAKKKVVKKEKPKTAEELDRDMEAYFMKDEKVAAKKLDEDMDTYWEQKKAKEAEDAKEAEAES